MKRIPAFLFLGLILISCGPRPEPEITIQEIQAHIFFLASDDLKGRYPGTAEDQRLMEYIASDLDVAGLELYRGTGLQQFTLVTSMELGPGNHFSRGAVSFVPGEDYIPLSFSSSGSAVAEVAFAGYGFRIDKGELDWDDYDGMNVEGKWVMIFRGGPGKQEASSPYMNYSEDRAKALLASDLGAAGVILISGYSFEPADQLEELKGKQHPLGIPVVQLGRAAAETLFASAGLDSLSLIEKKLGEKEAPVSMLTGIQVDIAVDLQPQEVETANVIATLPGSDPSLSGEYVIIGAHHDHLGLGGPGTSSRQPDTTAVHHGADDNASGVCGVLELAEYMAGVSPARSMLFATFGAEELGLVGSRYLAENPPVDLSRVQVMINMDMLGRLNQERQLQIGGIGTSPGFRDLLDSLNAGYGFNIKYGNEGYGPSDHAAFYAKDVPVLFISTGAHADYHTPADSAGAIHWKGMHEILGFISEVAETLANQQERIAFTEAGPKVRGSNRGHRGGITLGLMPDVTYDGNEGMPVMFVTEGKPAAAGGILKGDVITAIDGKKVGNVYDYMSRLGQLKEGQAVVVTVTRDGESMEILIRIF